MQSIEKLIKLNVLYIREMERRQILKINSYYEYWNILINNSSNYTIYEASQNLENNIFENSRIKYLKDQIQLLKYKTNDPSISNLRLAGDNLTEQELILQNVALRNMIYMNDLVSISEASERINRTTVAIKQACQQQRLLNTKIINNKTWFVHVGECEKYWGDKKVRIDCKSIKHD